jgi:hypothetical protein
MMGEYVSLFIPYTALNVSILNDKLERMWKQPVAAYF